MKKETKYEGSELKLKTNIGKGQSSLMNQILWLRRGFIQVPSSHIYSILYHGRNIDHTIWAPLDKDDLACERVNDLHDIINPFLIYSAQW